MSESFLAAATTRASDVATAKAASKAGPSGPPLLLTRLSMRPKGPRTALEQVKALAMATHPRLGMDSPASKLTPELCQLILGSIRSVPLVIDMGSGWCKVGFAGAAGPCAFFPSVVGVPRHPGIMVGELAQNGPFVGDEALRRRGVCRLKYPVEHCMVTNWDDVETMYKHVFYELRAAPEDHPVLLTEGTLNPKFSREKLTQLMFEKFNVPAMYLVTQAVLALYATGRTTGLVVESGDGVSWVTPVVEGSPLPHAALRYDMGGRDVTDYLMKILHEDMGLSCTTTADRDMVCDIKEQLAFVAMDFDGACQKAAAQKPEDRPCATYQPSEEMLKAASDKTFFDQRKRPDMPATGLPSSLHIPVDLLFRCPEVLFQPWLRGMSTCGIPDVAFNAVMKCDPDVRAELAANVVLAGGTMQIPGVAARLQQELSALMPTDMRVCVHPPADGQRLAWRGGSIVASEEDFERMCITREEYWEHGEYGEGATIVHRKCF